MVTPENKHKGNIIQPEHDFSRKIQVYPYPYLHVKTMKKGTMSFEEDKCWEELKWYKKKEKCINYIMISRSKK